MRKTWKLLTFAALLCLSLGIAACNGGSVGSADPVEDPAENVVIVLEAGTPSADLGKTGDVCLVAETGAFYRKTESGWEQTAYERYDADGSTLTVTYSDGSTGTYAMAASEETDCAHEGLAEAEYQTIYPAKCVIPGIGVKTCPACHESFPEILPANGEHKYEYGNYNCVLCGGAPNYFANGEMHETGTGAPEGYPEGYYLIANVPEAAVRDGKIEVPGEMFGLPVVIGSDAFTSAEKEELTNVILDEGIVGIEANAFAGCTNMTFLQLPDTLEFIGEAAFSETSALATDLVIPSKVETIGYGAFRDSGIMSVYIPASVSSLGTSFTATDVSGGTSDFNKEALQWTAQTYTSFVDEDSRQLIGEVFANTPLKEAVFEAGSSLKMIPHGCFYGCEDLEKVILPDGIELIGEGAFYGCDLRSVDLPDSVTTLLSGAFTKNEHLNHLGIGSGFEETLWAQTDVSVHTIAECFPELTAVCPEYMLPSLLPNLILGYPDVLNPAPFENCYRLVEIENRSDIGIETEAMQGIGVGKYARLLGVISGEGESRLTEKTAEEGAYTFYTAEDGKTCLVDFVSNGSTSLTLPELGKGYAIHDYAFYHDEDNADSTISKIDFGAEVTSIGVRAFENCIGFTTVDLFACENLTSIGDYAFFVDFDVEKQGTKLTTVKIGDSVETIGDSVFEYQSSLTTVYIGNCTQYSIKDTNHLTSIGENVFRICQKMQHVYFAGTYQDWLDCGGSSQLFAGHNTGAVPTYKLTLHCSDKNQDIVQS